MKIIDIIRISLFTAFVVICSYISFPLFNSIPFSMQIFAVFLISFSLSPVQSLFSIFLYLVMGAGGLPVFAMGNAGFAQFLKPSGGFLIGFIIFPLAQFLPIKNKIFKMIIAFIIFYLVGIFWMSYILNFSLFRCFYIIWYFIPLDIIKMIFAFLLSKKIKKIIFR